MRWLVISKAAHTVVKKHGDIVGGNAVMILFHFTGHFSSRKDTKLVLGAEVGKREVDGSGIRSLIPRVGRGR